MRRDHTNIAQIINKCVRWATQFISYCRLGMRIVIKTFQYFQMYLQSTYESVMLPITFPVHYKIINIHSLLTRTLKLIPLN